MTNEEINRRISELKDRWRHHCDGREATTERTRTMECIHCGSPVPAGTIRPINWTGDEAANAELLEEMPSPLMSFSSGHWHIHPNQFYEKWGDDGGALQASDPQRKTAVALAWLKWQESK